MKDDSNSSRCLIRILLLQLILLLTFVTNAQVVDTTLKGFSPYAFGAAISAQLLKNNSQYRNLVKKEFSSLTPETAMKFGVIHPGENTWYWTDADSIVSFAQQNNKRVHGHTLIWHNNVPAWVTNFVGDSAAWENIMKTHIQTVVTHFKGKVKSWDVVNEAVIDNGTLRNSIWLQHLGPNYIARAFQYAHEADTAALLFYNDFNHESSTNNYAKLYGIQALLTNLKLAGVPIHGTGLQMHVNKNINNSNIGKAIDSMLATGLKVHISELDVAVNPENNQSLTFNATVASQQFGKFKYFGRVGKQIGSDQFYGITTWNVTDADSWIPQTYSRPDFPLPFSNTYQKKSSYQGFKDGMLHQWNAAAATTAQSFLGTYSDLGSNGNAITTNFSGNAMSFDNDNSAVQNIGFDFIFNGTVYSQFVLNTNGYIKLGASAPSSTSVFYPAYNGNTGSVITASDIDLIYPYNHDLTAGSGLPEYRVYTSGNPGSRICTIQFKNLSDKLAPVQYSNIEFQVKLYESNNAIEFIYGNWIPSSNTSTSVTAAVGIKGVNAFESINVAKGSTVAWNTSLSTSNNYYFKNGDYPLNGPQFNSRNTFLPEPGRTFRFGSSSVLPLTFIYFTGVDKENHISLQWKAAENDLLGFGIERSVDGINFTQVAFINATGQGEYQYRDYNVAEATVYYRLRSIGASSVPVYSPIIRISRNISDSFAVTISSFFTDVIHLQVKSNKQQKVSVLCNSIDGSVIANADYIIYQGVNAIQMRVPVVSKGTYLLRVQTAENQRTIKIIKQ